MIKSLIESKIIIILYDNHSLITNFYYNIFYGRSKSFYNPGSNFQKKLESKSENSIMP